MFLFGSNGDDSGEPPTEIKAKADEDPTDETVIHLEDKFQHQFRVEHDYVIGYEFPAVMRKMPQSVDDWEAVYVQPLETKDEREPKFDCFDAIRRRYHRPFLFQVLLIEQHIVWEILVFASIVVNCSLTSFYFYFQRSEFHLLFPWIHLLDSIYLADFLLAAIATYTLTWRRFFKMNRRSNLAIMTDIVSLLPLDFFYYIAYPVNPKTLFYLHLNSYLRLYRVYLFFKRHANLAGAHRTLLFYARYITLLSVAVHVFSCLWFSSAVESKNTVDWTDDLGSFSNINKHWEWYLLCVYYALATFVNLGYGDIHASNRFEYILSSIGMVLGFLLTTVMFIGSLSSQNLEEGTKLNDYRRKITAIKSRLKSAGFSPEEVDEQLSFFEVMWYKNFLCIIESATALPILPVSMRKELCFAINVQLYRTSFLLQQIGEAHLRTVSLFIKSEFYHPGDVVLHRGTVKEKVILVKFGEIDVVSEEDDESSILTFSAGTCLAECALVMVWPSKTLIRARTFTELQVLHHADFNRILADYPEIIQQLRVSVQERIAMAKDDKAQKGTGDYVIGLSLLPMMSAPDIRIIKEKLELKESKRKRAEKVTMTQEDKFLDLYETRRPRISSHNVSASSTLPVLCMGYFPWILLPGTVLTKVWQYAVVVIALVIAFLYPHLIAFTTIVIPALDTFHIVVDAVFALDIYVQCTTAMEIKGELIAKVKYIVARQMKTFTFFLDVLAALPLHWLSLIYTRDKDMLFRTNKLFKCWRISLFFNEKENDLWANVMIWKVLKYALFLSMAAYWSAALLYIAATYNPRPETSWLETLTKTEKENLDPDPLYKYPELLSAYFSLNTLCGIGFTNVTPKNFPEVGMIIVLILMGILLLGYYMAEFSTAFYFGGRLRSMYQEKYITTLQFMKEKGVHPEIVDRALNFLYVQWEYDKGNGISQETSMFPTISEKHQEHILLKEMVETLQHAPIFQLTDTNMLLLVAKKGRVRVLPPGEYIYQAGTWMMTMYIIQEGYCVELDQYERGTGRVLAPGSEFGALGMFYTLKSVRAIRTITHCKLISIERKTFTRVTSIFPLIWETNNDIAKQFNDRVTKFFEGYKYIDRKTIQMNHPPSFIVRSEINQVHKHILNGFHSSFQRTYRKNDAENYWKPFRSLGVFDFLSHLVMPWSVLPTSNFLKAWCIARAVTVWIVAFYLPVDKTLDMAGVEEKSWLIPFDLFAYADIYLMFHVGYYNAKGILVTHPYYTGKKYFKSNFFIDLIAVLPFELLAKKTNGSLRQLLRINRIIQAYRLIGAFDYLGGNILKPLGMLQLFKYLPMVIIIANISTTVFVILSCNVVSNGVIECKNGSFIQNFNHENSSQPLHIYAIGYYWVTSTLFGFGFVNPYTSYVLPLTVVLIVLGFLLFGFICAIVSSNKLQKNTDLILYMDKLTELKEFMDQESVHTTLKDKIVSHFEYNLFRTKGVEIQELFPFFNQALREDVYLSHYEKIFANVPTLNSPNNDFIRHIGGQIREYFFTAGETIIRANYIESNVYVIGRGEVKLSNKAGQFLANLRPGDMFGNLQSSHSVLANITATCNTDADILLIASDWFQENLDFHPVVRDRIASQLEDTQEYIKQEIHSYEFKSRSDDNVYVVPVTLKPKLYMSVSSTRFHQDSETHRWWEKTIMPHSVINTAVDIVLLVCSYINCLKVTFQFTFQYQWPFYIHMMDITDLLYFLNMYVQARKAYINQYGKIISKYQLISHRYFHSKRFAFELLINIPYYLVAFAFRGDQHMFLYSALQLIHLFRMYYIIEFYKNCQRAATTAVNASAIFIWTSLFAHFCACFLYLVTCPLHKCRKESWILKSYETLTRYISMRYFVALYYALQLFTGTSYGYMQPYYLDEIIVLTALMIVIKFAVCVLIANVTDLFCSEDRVLKTYEKNMNILHDMMKSQNANPYLRKRVQSYVLKLWKYEHGVQRPSLLVQMPLQLRLELLWAIYGHHIERAYPFKELDMCFLQQLVMHLNHTVYFTDNYVVRSGDVDLRMHFIHRGEVAMLSLHKHSSETIHEILEAGQMFGIAQGLYRGMPHCFSYRARTNTDVLSLHLDSWSYLLHYYPTLQKEIYDRVNSLRKIPEDHQE